MKNDERILKLPQPIIDRLREVIRRIRRLQWIKGSLFTLAAAVAAALVLMALDSAFSLESLPLRLALSLAGLAGTLWVAWRYWLRPLSRRISLTAVARWVESRHPELQERISTAVELLDDRQASDQGSRELLDAVVQDAVADVGRLDPLQDLSPRRTRPAQWLAGTAVAVLMVITAIWPGKIPRLLVRAVAPMADIGNTWADRLRVLTQSQVVAIGDPLVIEVALRGPAERVELHLTDIDGSPVVEMLQPDATVPTEPGESGYTLRTPAVQQSFTAKIVAGKAISASFVITALPRPESGAWTLTYDFPDYTGLPDKVTTAASGEIAAWAGTKVSARSKLNRPAAEASIKIGEETISEVRLNPDPADPEVTWSTVLTPGLDTLWSLHLKDDHGIANRPVDLPIRSVTDLPPVITLETPVEDRMELRPTEKLPLTFLVKEDIGLSAVQIRVRLQDKPEFLFPPETLPEPSPGKMNEYRGTVVLDLARVVVPDGLEIRVSLMAADRVPPQIQGPQRGYSREITIRLNRWSRPRVEKNFEDQHQELRKKMEDVKKELYSAKGRMNDKPDRLNREEKLSENTLKDLEASTNHLQQAEALLKELAQRMKETAYARQTPAMEEIAQQMVQPAKASAKEIPLTDQKDARAELAKDTKDLLEIAIKQMEKEQEQMEQSRQGVQQAAKLSDIAEQQMRLAAEATRATTGTSPAEAQADSPRVLTGPTGATTPPSTENTVPAPTDAEQRKWLEEQRRVAQRAKELMEQNVNSNPLATQEQMKQAATQAAQLAAEAEALSQQELQLASAMEVASTPEAKQQTAAAQQQLAELATALQEKAKGFQEKSTQQINQSTETQSKAFEAQSQLEEASAQAKEATTAITAASQGKPSTSSPDETGQPEAPASNAGSPAPPAAPNSMPAGTLTAQNAKDIPAAMPEPKATQPDKTENPSTPVTASSSTSTTLLAAKGQKAALASSASLTEAAVSLKALGTEMNSLAGILADHSNSLGEGAQQAGTAVDQAAKPQNEQGKGPSMQQGASAAQQAADQLAMAANTMMQAMSIPAGAKFSQASASSKGQGKPQNRQPQPASSGQDGKDGMQMDTASSTLPAELAKLGLTQDDWMKLKSTLQGVDGAKSEQVPAEYRDLLKAYFGAIAKGNPAK